MHLAKEVVDAAARERLGVAIQDRLAALQAGARGLDEGDEYLCAAGEDFSHGCQPFGALVFLRAHRRFELSLHAHVGAEQHHANGATLVHEGTKLELEGDAFASLLDERALLGGILFADVPVVRRRREGHLQPFVEGHGVDVVGSGVRIQQIADRPALELRSFEQDGRLTRDRAHDGASGVEGHDRLAHVVEELAQVAGDGLQGRDEAPIADEHSEVPADHLEVNEVVVGKRFVRGRDARADPCHEKKLAERLVREQAPKEALQPEDARERRSGRVGSPVEHPLRALVKSAPMGFVEHDLVVDRSLQSARQQRELAGLARVLKRGRGLETKLPDHDGRPRVAHRDRRLRTNLHGKAMKRVKPRKHALAPEPKTVHLPLALVDQRRFRLEQFA